MRRTLEVIFRHPLQLLMIIISLPILGVAVAYVIVPRTYQSTASVWALQRYFVIGATGLESDITSSPALTQATALNELLQTRAFALEIAQHTNLAASLGLSGNATSDAQVQNALYNDISKHVLAIPSAYSLYEISYTNHYPQVAQQVLQAVITNFGSQSLKLSVAEGQNLLGNFQTQLASAQKVANSIVSAESKYIAAHPDLKLATDPEYQLLDAQRVQAQKNIQDLQSTVDQIQQSIKIQGSNVNSLFQVVDAPQPAQRLSRTKDYLVGGVIGLVLAILACSIFLVVLVRRDRGVYSAFDLKDVVQFPVVLQLPKLTPIAITLLTTTKKHDQALLTDGGSSPKVILIDSEKE